jgi:pSer/pThr/pTyr-binding forkhead associated (FHA) protein
LDKFHVTEPILRLIHIDTGKSFVLPNNKETIYIGRQNDLIPVDVDLSDVPDADVISRVHSTIHVEPEGYYLEDAGSLNGTFVNDQEIETGARYRTQIQSGDTIVFGRNRQLKFTFEVET